MLECGAKKINLEGSYPKLKMLAHNSYYQGILQNLFCGSEGEVVAILQLSYQKSLLCFHQSPLSKIITSILQHDQKHIELLSDAIMTLGGNPMYYNNQKKFLSLRQIDYLSNPQSMLRADIELKEKTIIDYKVAISKISNTNLKMYLERIVQDEKLHLKLLRQSLENISNI